MIITIQKFVQNITEQFSDSLNLFTKRITEFMEELLQLNKQLGCQ